MCACLSLKVLKASSLFCVASVELLRCLSGSIDRASPAPPMLCFEIRGGIRFLSFREKVKRKAPVPTKSIDPVRDESCYNLPSAVPLFLLSLIDNPFVQTQQSAGPDNGACRPYLLYYPTTPYRALFGTAARKEINIRHTALPRTSRQLSERVDRRPIGLATTHF